MILNNGKKTIKKGNISAKKQRNCPALPTLNHWVKTVMNQSTKCAKSVAVWIYFKGKSERDVMRKTNRRRRSEPEMLGVIQPCSNGNEQAAIKEMKVKSFVLFLKTWRLWWSVEEPKDIYIIVAGLSTSKAKCPFCGAGQRFNNQYNRKYWWWWNTSLILERKSSHCGLQNDWQQSKKGRGLWAGQSYSVVGYLTRETSFPPAEALKTL